MMVNVFKLTSAEGWTNKKELTESLHAKFDAFFPEGGVGGGKRKKRSSKKRKSPKKRRAKKRKSSKKRNPSKKRKSSKKRRR